MSNHVPGPEFFLRANALINVSNDQCDSADPGEVAASTLYAAARFGAFLVARSTGNAQNMALEKERALQYFSDQFRSMLANNLEDFAANYDKYMGTDQS